PADRSDTGDCLMHLASSLRRLPSRAARLFRNGPAKPRRHPARPVLERPEGRAVPSVTNDTLYVGDNASNGKSGDNSVQSFDATTGASLGTFVPGSNSLKGVRVLIFDGAGHLLVPIQDPNAPFAPRGIVLKDNVLYVANLQDSGTTKAGIAPDGEIDKYDGT